MAGFRAILSRLMRDEAGTAVFVFTAATLMLRLGGNIVLTRLLDPGAFGVVGIIVSIMVTLTMMSDLGFRDFVVHGCQPPDRLRENPLEPSRFCPRYAAQSAA